MRWRFTSPIAVDVGPLVVNIPTLVAVTSTTPTVVSVGVLLLLPVASAAAGVCWGSSGGDALSPLVSSKVTASSPAPKTGWFTTVSEVFDAEVDTLEFCSIRKMLCCCC